MSYQAIARKWRPTTFSEIAGQDHVTRTLQNALRLGRIHHALLFTGARGVGKTTAARTMARALNCAEGPTPEPCGECGNCLEMLAGASPDVVEIDGASNNSVNDVRELRDTVAYLPSKGRYRVYIIDEVHMLSQGAFNALLKTLEEPPAHVVFLFATTEPQKIPDTVLSRVQRFDFKRIPASVVAGRLRTICEAEGVTISDAGLRTIARAGEGSMRDAQSLLDQVIAFGGDSISDQQVSDILGLVDREILYTMLEGLVTGEPGLCLDAIARVHDFGFELSQFTAELLELLRNATLVALSPSARKHVDAPGEELERLAAMADRMSVDVLSQWFQALLEVHDQISRSPYPRMVLEMAVARLAQARPVRSVDELLGRMEHLERALRSGGATPPPPGGGSGGGSGGAGPSGPAARGRNKPGGAAGHRAAPPSATRPEARGTGPAAERRADSPRRAGGPRPPEPRQGSRSASSWPDAGVTAPQKADSRRADPQPRSSARQSGPRQSGPRPPAAARDPEHPAAHRAAPEERADRAELPPAPPPDALLDDRDAGPAPFPDEDGAPPAGPSLVLHTDNEARYRHFLSSLQPEGLRYDVLIEHSVFSGQHGDTLRIAFPDGFLLSRGQKLVEDPTVVSLARASFPGVRRLEAVARSDGQGQTLKEARAERLERHRQQLLEEARQDELIRSLCQALDAEIEDIVPLSIPPEED